MTNMKKFFTLLLMVNIAIGSSAQLPTNKLSASIGLGVPITFFSVKSGWVGIYSGALRYSFNKNLSLQAGITANEFNGYPNNPSSTTVTPNYAAKDVVSFRTEVYGLSGTVFYNLHKIKGIDDTKFLPYLSFGAGLLYYKPTASYVNGISSSAIVFGPPARDYQFGLGTRYYINSMLDLYGGAEYHFIESYWMDGAAADQKLDTYLNLYGGVSIKLGAKPWGNLVDWSHKDIKDPKNPKMDYSHWAVDGTFGVPYVFSPVGSDFSGMFGLGIRYSVNTALGIQLNYNGGNLTGSQDVMLTTTKGTGQPIFVKDYNTKIKQFTVRGVFNLRNLTSEPAERTQWNHYASVGAGYMRGTQDITYSDNSTQTGAKIYMDPGIESIIVGYEARKYLANNLDFIVGADFSMNQSKYIDGAYDKGSLNSHIYTHVGLSYKVVKNRDQEHIDWSHSSYKNPVYQPEEYKYTPDGQNLNKFSLGIRLSNLYDLKYTAYDILPSGFNASDPYGLHGPKTKFDIAAGLDLSYFFSPSFSMDLSYDKGKMTGANLTEYYQSNVSLLGWGANYDLKRIIHTADYKLVPYVRVSVSRGAYDAERKFIKDDITFNRTSGKAMVVGFGAGLRYHIDQNWHVNLMSEYMTIHTDAWDGWDYGSGRDQMIKTSLGLRYSFGHGKHIDQIPLSKIKEREYKTDKMIASQNKGGEKQGDKSPGLKNDTRVEKVQSNIDKQINKAVKDLSQLDSLEKQINGINSMDADQDGVPDKYDNCPNVFGLFSNNGCPDITGKTSNNTKAPGTGADNTKAPGTINMGEISKAPGSGKTEPNSKTIDVGKLNSSSQENSALSIGTTTFIYHANDRVKNEVLLEISMVRFALGSTKLTPKAIENLNTVAVVMLNNPGYVLNVFGYTDATGSDAVNMKLAEKRANKVSAYLLSRGVSLDRLKISVMGKVNPIDNNENKVGQANNRRVEFRLEK